MASERGGVRQVFSITLIISRGGFKEEAASNSLPECCPLVLSMEEVGGCRQPSRLAGEMEGFFFPKILRFTTPSRRSVKGPWQPRSGSVDKAVRELQQQQLMNSGKKSSSLRNIWSKKLEGSRSSNSGRTQQRKRHQMMDDVFQPRVLLHRLVLPADVKEEAPEEQSPDVDQQEPEPLQIKEEQEELWTSQEGEQLTVKEETDTRTISVTCSWLECQHHNHLTGHDRRYSKHGRRLVRRAQSPGIFLTSVDQFLHRAIHLPWSPFTCGRYLFSTRIRCSIPSAPFLDICAGKVSTLGICTILLRLHLLLQLLLLQTQ
ncbi:hypothetical protein CRENBAI_000597 [Crenichthys baileyi]|uniref:Uncharacterized protein n=1 Tax=Crenichthys baileyi TaxID=28760 RepID=A0AAV9RVT6_9TELE